MTEVYQHDEDPRWIPSFMFERATANQIERKAASDLPKHTLDHAASPSLATAPPLVDEVLRSPGQPLEPAPKHCAIARGFFKS